jgi:hypothetical protein
VHKIRTNFFQIPFLVCGDFACSLSWPRSTSFRIFSISNISSRLIVQTIQVLNFELIDTFLNWTWDINFERRKFVSVPFFKIRNCARTLTVMSARPVKIWKKETPHRLLICAVSQSVVLKVRSANANIPFIISAYVLLMSQFIGAAVIVLCFTLFREPPSKNKTGLPASCFRSYSFHPIGTVGAFYLLIVNRRC